MSAPKRILVIDDEMSIRFVLKACLEDMAGWDVVTASSGKEGLLKSQTESPDAILLDVSMPEMDGIQVLNILQADQDTASIPVLLLTAHTMRVEREKDHIRGVVRVLGKPFDPISLIGEISDALGWSMQSNLEEKI